MSKRKITYTSLSADEDLHRSFEEALERVPDMLGKRHPLWIEGKPVYANREFRVQSPIDSSLSMGTFQEAEHSHVNTAIDSANTAFSTWSALEWNHRASILQRIADQLDKELFSLAALASLEVGKNRSESIAEIGEAVDMIRYHVEVYKQNQGFIQPMQPDPEGGSTRSIMRPHGVWVVISPFNFPVSLAAGMVSAALLTGNTVIMKPTSKAPLSGLYLYRAFVDGGIPAEAIQFLTGPGKSFGSWIVRHPDVAGIAFTGSQEAGMWLYRNFSSQQPYPKPLIAEMGSKNPALVTFHADVDKAVEGIARSAFGYGGQKCSATSRAYIHAGVMDAFVSGLLDWVKQIVVGDPLKREVFMGPVIDAHAVDTFRMAVEACKQSGGKILCGGKVLKGPEYPSDFYVEPTVVTGLSPDHPLIFKELFVPFLILETFDHLEDAMARANATDYGLTAGIFTEKTEEIEYFFRHIQSGVCYSNRKGGATTGAWPGSQAFGGWNGSGSTGKGIGGPYYLLSYIREQAQTRIK
jgi:1-pyrroline-5-carboxylate dehydrogenase